MKQILLLMAPMMVASVLYCSCSKADTDATPPGVSRIETLITESQSTATNDIRNAAKMLGDENVSGIVLDMTRLDTLELGDANLAESIEALMSAVDENSAKSVRLIIPNLSIRGNVNMPPRFYEFTRGSNKYNAATRVDNNTTATPATIIIQDDGSLHFSGELQSSELLSVLSVISTDSIPRITADRIKITERMGTMSDGPTHGLPMWAIFDLVKTNEISVGTDDRTGGVFDGSGSVLFGHLGDTGHVELKNAGNLAFYDFGDKELRRSSTPAHRRENARVEFDQPINMMSEFFTDTVRMGGSWNNGVWTPDESNWLDVIAESQMAYGRPYIVYPAGYLQMTDAQRKQEYRLIIHTEGTRPGSDTIIDGVRRHWVNLQEIIDFNTTVLTGDANIKWRAGVPLAVRVPTERTPAELKAPIDGELHSWGNFFFYDCRINTGLFPDHVEPIVPVVDTTMKLNLTRANQVRAQTRAAAARSSINTRGH